MVAQVLLCDSNLLRGLMFFLRLMYLQVTPIPFLPFPIPESKLPVWLALRLPCPPAPLPPPHNKAPHSASVTSVGPGQHPHHQVEPQGPRPLQSLGWDSLRSVVPDCDFGLSRPKGSRISSRAQDGPSLRPLGGPCPL